MGGWSVSKQGNTDLFLCHNFFLKSTFLFHLCFFFCGRHELSLLSLGVSRVVVGVFVWIVSADSLDSGIDVIIFRSIFF